MACQDEKSAAQRVVLLHSRWLRVVLFGPAAGGFRLPTPSAADGAFRRCAFTVGEGTDSYCAAAGRDSNCSDRSICIFPDFFAPEENRIRVQCCPVCEKISCNSHR